MSRTMTLSALAAAALLAAAGFAPGAASAGEFETNARRCADPLGDLDLRIGACTWLLQSGRIAEGSVLVVFHSRGNAWYQKGEHDRAIEDYTAALRIEPDNHDSLNGLAWVLATAPEALVRDGSRAVRLAEKAISLQGTANNHDTLAAAYAEAGRFTDAVGTQERSLAMARAEGSSAEELADFHDRLRLYRQGRPYREQR